MPSAPGSSRAPAGALRGGPSAPRRARVSIGIARAALDPEASTRSTCGGRGERRVDVALLLAESGADVVGRRGGRGATPGRPRARGRRPPAAARRRPGSARARPRRRSGRAPRPWRPSSPDVADLSRASAYWVRGCGERLVRDEQRQRSAHGRLEVLVGVDAEHALDVERAGDVDVADPRVRRARSARRRRGPRRARSRRRSGPRPVSSRRPRSARPARRTARWSSRSSSIAAAPADGPHDALVARAAAEIARRSPRGSRRRSARVLAQ